MGEILWRFGLYVLFGCVMILGFQAFSQVWVLMLGKLWEQLCCVHVNDDVWIIFGGLDGFWIVVMGLDLSSIVSMVEYSDFCNILVARSFINGRWLRLIPLFTS